MEKTVYTRSPCTPNAPTCGGWPTTRPRRCCAPRRTSSPPRTPPRPTATAGWRTWRRPSRTVAGVTRRTFVAGAAATATALATAQFVTTSASFAATKTGTLIHVFLYGGLDGLSLVAPADDPVLAKARPDLLLGNDSLALGRGFKLTSAFKPLEKWLKAGQLGFIPAVSDERLSRSHFQAADACNLGGLPNETGGRGWLDGLVDTLGKGTAFRSVGIGSTLPRSLVGNNGALSLNSVGSLRLNGDERFRAATEKAIRGLFTGINHPVEEAVQEGMGALATAQKLAAKPYQPRRGRQVRGRRERVPAARPADQGRGERPGRHRRHGRLRHPREPGHPRGRPAAPAAQRAGQRHGRVLHRPRRPKAADVTIMVSSEFGRRVGSNGGGTDHGHGGVVTVLSGTQARRLAARHLERPGQAGLRRRARVQQHVQRLRRRGAGPVRADQRGGRQGLPPAEVHPDEAVRVTYQHTHAAGRRTGTSSRHGGRSAAPVPPPLPGPARARRPAAAGRAVLGRPGRRGAAVVAGHPGRLAGRHRRRCSPRPGGSPA